MPTISIRGNEMPASPIRKLAPLADAAKQRGVHVFHLNIGQPDLPTPQAAIDAIRNIDRKVLEYSPSAGNRSYREKLVGYYAKFNINLTADDIIITSGGSEAVLFSFLSCLNPGDEIIVPEPAYANYMAFAISAGAKIRTIATTIEEGFSLPKVEKFEELINERTKAILICNPNNPTGYLYTRREMNQIRDLVKKYDLFLFSDEVYREFIYTGSPYISACHLEGIENNVVLIDSVSKRYSECGIRIGALITKNKEIRDAVMKFCQARLSPPLIGQIAAEAALGGVVEPVEERGGGDLILAQRGHRVAAGRAGHGQIGVGHLGQVHGLRLGCVPGRGGVSGAACASGTAPGSLTAAQSGEGQGKGQRESPKSFHHVHSFFLSSMVKSQGLIISHIGRGSKSDSALPAGPRRGIMKKIREE